MKHQYLQDQKNKILAFAREQYEYGEITMEKLTETYYHLFIKNK